jgi:2-methylisocitrate lyase-like PEP mutase family enzyme
VLEDQKRPRQCGHEEGKQILDLDEYLAKLSKVLATRKELVVVARTDATDEAEIARRVESFAEAGADAVLVDGVQDLRLLESLRQRVRVPLAFNQIAGGKSPPCTLAQLQALGVSLVIYSTPCLFAAQAALEEAMQLLKASDGSLPVPNDGGVTVKECTALLNENWQGRDKG